MTRSTTGSKIFWTSSLQTVSLHPSSTGERLVPFHSVESTLHIQLLVVLYTGNSDVVSSEGGGSIAELHVEDKRRAITRRLKE